MFCLAVRAKFKLSVRIESLNFRGSVLLRFGCDWLGTRPKLVSLFALVLVVNLICEHALADMLEQYHSV